MRTLLYQITQRVQRLLVVFLVVAFFGSGMISGYAAEQDKLRTIDGTHLIDRNTAANLEGARFIPREIPTATLHSTLGTMTIGAIERKTDAGGDTLNNSVDAITAGVNFLTQNQKADGLWETKPGTAFLETVAVIEFLESFGSTTAQTYLTAIDWINLFFPGNEFNIADKIRILSANGIDIGPVDDYLASQLSPTDGGFGFGRAFVSDAVTTAKVLRAITASGYQDPGDNPNLTLLSTLVYLINHQSPDGGWPEAAELPSSIYAAAVVLEALEPYQTFTISGLPGGDVAISDRIALALSYLANTQAADGTWNGDLLDTAFAFRALTRHQASVTYGDAAISYLLASQAGDGSFGASFFATAKVLQALVDADLAHPDLAITSVTPTTPLVNGSPATFDLRIFNQGGQTAVGGKLHLFADDLFFGVFDLSAAGVSIAPGAELSLLLTLDGGATTRFIGPTELRWYVETDGESDAADNWSSATHTFASNPTGASSLHLFYVARAAVASGVPAVTMDWANKADANKLYNAFLYRPAGTTGWYVIALDPAWNNVTVSGFPEGSAYDITAGVVFTDGATVLYDAAVTTITMSADSTLYPGGVAGLATVNSASTSALTITGFGGVSAVTDDSGAFAVSGLPNGSNVFFVADPLYEINMTRALVPVNGTTTSVRVFTRLKEDTQAPVVTSFSVLNESDFTFPNQQTVTLSVSGTDNETIKEADFRLFDPNTGVWNYLGTASFTPAGTTTAAFPWFAPITLLGPGYQLEATLQDYQNNFSLPALWGPFTVTPGNGVPALTITAPGTATTSVDEIFTIAWTDDDPDSDAAIALYYDVNSTGEDGTLIVSGLSEDSPLDQYTWRTLPIPDGDYFVYGVIGDGLATTTDYSDGAVTITHINDPPVALNDVYATNEDTPLTIAAPGVLMNDTDIEGNPLTAILQTNVATGTLALFSDGSFSYTSPRDWNGIVTFTYLANDGALNSNIATATIAVNPVNDPPIALDDVYATNEDTLLVVNALAGVLANDTDIEGSPLTAILATTTSQGILNLAGDGSFTYTPNPNFNGTDTFTYTASDGFLSSNVATVTLTVNSVNDEPVAVDDIYATDEDATLAVPALTGVLANDTDIEGDPLTAILVASTTSGTLLLSLDGSFTYTPAADFNGSDAFTYLANDGISNSNIATATIIVSPVNDAPVAANDVYATDEDTTLVVSALTGVLTNDMDIEGDPLTAVLVATTTNGTLTLNPDGSFSYTPSFNWNDTDSFTYLANDGLLNSNVATATITVNPVNDAPVATNDFYITDEDTPLTITAPGVLANDTDIDSPTLTAVLESDVTAGALALNPDGSFVYTPPADWNGAAIFTYKANDGTLDSNVATVTITIQPVNDPPVAFNDIYATDEDIPLVVDAASGVLVNDTDVENDPLSAVLVTNVTNGILALNLDGSFVYTPAPNFFGIDSFTYLANDRALNSNIATATIAVNPVNDAPVAVNDAYATNENTALTIAAPGVLVNDTDIEDDPLSAVLVTATANGSLVFNSDGSFTYTPFANFVGIDFFTYQASDGGENSNVAAATITVNRVLRTNKGR